MRIYDPLYLSTVSSSSATRRIPSAMGLYRIEGGCLYRIKIRRYRTALSREKLLSLYTQRANERQHQHQQHTGSSSSTSNHSTSNSGRALGPLTLHEFRDAPPLLHSHPPYNPLPPSYSLSLFLPTFIFPRFREVSRAPRRDNGQVAGGGGGRKEHESRSKEHRVRLAYVCARWRGEITVSSERNEESPWTTVGER